MLDSWDGSQFVTKFVDFTMETVGRDGRPDGGRMISSYPLLSSGALHPSLFSPAPTRELRPMTEVLKS